MHYTLSYHKPENHMLDISLTCDLEAKDEIVLQFPAWRPGRYELGDFAKNIQKWTVKDDKGNNLKWVKISKDQWKVYTKGANKIQVDYTYYANELNAGSTYLDETQLYVNPVNCFVYLEHKQNEKCTMELKLPKRYKVAGSLSKTKGFEFSAKDYHELVDSPFIASDSLLHHTFESNKVTFHLWFQGECKPNLVKITKDFKHYTDKQIKLFGEFPVEEYHYLFQILPYQHYHGVEHYASTVISLGPTYKLMDKELYDELLGVSCHELFHTWNIKQIRPAEMHPYDYSKENYSTLGYVAEGVTTYYGDLMLLRGKVFNQEEYLKILADQFQKHVHNFGRFNKSLAESSWDTWLDGYVKGIPNRKLSIYADGCIIAFITDVMIRKNTKNKKSLDDVMYKLYHDFAKKGRGYTDEDYINVVSKLAEKQLAKFFNDFVYNTNDYTQYFKESLKYLGLELKLKDSDNVYETHYGFKANDSNVVTDVYVDSIADKMGMSVGDKITHINNYQVQGNLNQWLKFYDKDKVKLLVQRKYGRHSIELQRGKESYYQKCTLQLIKGMSKNQKENFKSWVK